LIGDVTFTQDAGSFVTSSGTPLTIATGSVSGDVIANVHGTCVGGADALFDARTTVGGNQAFAFLANKDAAFTGNAGELRWFQQNVSGTASDKTIIEGDINGDGTRDFQIQLTGLKTLTSADFFL
jgi:hypothetical protein